jgi:hypothetical protein
LLLSLAEVLFAVEQAMFHPLVLWSLWTLAVWMYVSGRGRVRSLQPLQRRLSCSRASGSEMADARELGRRGNRG